MQPHKPGQAVLAAADRQRLEIRVIGYRQRGDDGGQGVTADELQHHPPGPGRPDPAQHRAEPVRQGLRVLGDISGGLAGHEPDGHPVGVPGRGHLAEHRQDDPALMPGRHAGDGHDPGPAAPVEPAPPLAPRRIGDPPGERARPEVPPGGQDHHDPGHQEDEPRPADVDPGQDQHRDDGGGQRVPGDHADQPGQQPVQMHHQDDPGRGLVDRRPPDGQGERVAVVQLGHLLAGYDLAHTLVTSFVHTGENPGAAGGTSSSRPACICRAITPPARQNPGPPSRGSWRRASPARPRTGPRPRPAGGRTARPARLPRPGRGW